MKKIIKKGIFIFIISVIIIFLIFSQSGKKEKNTIETDKFLPILFLIVDQEKTTENISVKDAAEMDDIQMGVISSTVAIERGKYSFKINHVNDKLLENISDYVFTLHDANGVVISEAKFDIKSKMVTLPKEYYKNIDSSNSTTDSSPIQMQIVSRMKKKDYENLQISINTHNVFKTKKTISIDARDTITSLSLKKYDSNKKIDKNDINIYVNGSSDKLHSDYYTWDNKAGTLTININPLFIKNIEIEYKSKLTKIFDFIKDVFAVNFKKISGFYKELDSIDTDYSWSGKTWTEELSFKYIGSSCYNNIDDCTWGDRSDATIAAMKKSFNSVEDYLCFSTDGSTSDTCGEEGASYHPFIINLSGHTLSKTEIIEKSDGTKTEVIHEIKFKSNTYVTIYCDEENSKLNSADDNKIKVTIKVVKFDKTNNYIVFSFDTKESNAGQSGYGLVKFNYSKTNYAKIHVEKYWKDLNGTSKLGGVKGIQIGLYEDSTCSTKITSKKTNSNGNVNFNNLDLDTYYVKEMGFGNAPSPYDSNHYMLDPNCYPVTVSETSYDSKETDSDDGYNIYIKNISLTQQKKYYCFKVKKVDAENPSCLLDGASFTSNGVTKTTSGGVATFDYLDYGTYTYTESFPNQNLPSILTSSCGNYTYWNDNASSYTATLKEMAYNSATNTYSCEADPATHTHGNKKTYHCMKVKKVDAVTKELLKGASFSTTIGGSKVTKKDSDDGKEDGITTFFLGTNTGQFSVSEVTAPTGYALNTKPITTTSVLLPQGYTVAQAEAACLNADATGANGVRIDAQAAETPDSKLLLNWFKTTENGETKANGAKFKVKDASNKYVQVNGTIKQTDESGITKTCYKYSSMVDESSASVLDSMNTATNNGTTNGETCIAGLPDGTYTVTETQPVQYHTFNSYDNITITAQTKFAAMGTTNKFINSPTRLVFTKTVDYGDETDELKTLTTQELKKLKFNVFDSNNNKLSFVLKDGVYQYTGNIIDGPGTTDATTELQLNDNRQLTVEHLPWGTYSIKEQETDGCVDYKGNACSGNGFYYPEYSKTSDYQFVINQNSSDEATIKSGKNVVQSLTNTPTEITFTKDDLYGYIDEKDYTKFENEEEIEQFDDITFRLKDAQGNYLSLLKIKDGEYRYTKGVGDNLVTDLHTADGTFKITHLCRNSEYVIEEYAIPANSIFILPIKHPEVTYKIPITKGKVTPESNTQMIENTATRVRFEKRDSKYNYLIPDETTTFQVYRCKKGTECHPTDENDQNSVLVKFSKRAVIENTNEDKTDAEGLSGVEVYKYLTTSDEKAGTEGVTDLHPYKGILVLRYLPANYDYVLVETVAPKNYTLPEGRNAETRFTVLDNTVEIDQVDIPNKPTSILIRKYSDDGELLEGAEFKIYEGTTCDANLSPMNQPKKALKLKTIRDGVYESRPETDTDTIVTCTDREDAKCSDISTNNATKLTYNNYLGTWADFDDESTKTEDGTKIELQQGEALIQYLEYGHCYIIEEVKAPKGYSLPKNAEDRFTMVTIKENDMYVHDTMKNLINKPTPFTFYKYDEFNQLLDGAEFKLQKLDQNKKYQDVTVIREEKDDKVYYKVDEETDNTVITTINGSATVYYLEAGQYRIVETKPAPGKELNKNPNVATFFIDDSGNSYGNAIIVNKPKTDKIEIKNSATAELIVNIQTGQTVIKYGLIIAVLVALLSGLMIIRKKMK